MKHHLNRFALLAGCLLLFMLCACGKEAAPQNTETETVPVTVSETTKEEDSAMKLNTWIINGFDKLLQETEAPADCAAEYDLYMARNEAEGCQIAIRADQRMPGCTLSCTASDEGAPALTLLKEFTISMKDAHYPDPLAPFSGKLTLLPDRTNVVYADFHTDASTSAGTYSYTLTLENQEEVLKTYTIRVHVWDFALPETTACATAVGLYRESLTLMHGTQPGEDLEALYRAYYELLLSYKISAYDLPYEILDDRADAYMNDPRVTSFRVPTCEDDDAQLEKIYQKLSSNPAWLAKAYFYPLDEPTDKTMLLDFEKMCDRLHKIAPEIYICTPFFRNIDVDADTDQIGFMTGKTNLWCPKSFMYKSSNIYSDAQMKKYPPFGERMAERKAAGDRVWWYVCWEPGDPYNNMYVDQKGIQHRILFWQQYAHDVDGFLYWASNFWTGTPDPWTDMATVKGLSPDVYGDGSLVYNGNHVGFDNSGCPSLRLTAIRDGIEDFDLFKMAEKLLGKEWLDAEIAKITTSITDYTMDSDLLLSVRRAIGDAVEKASKEA